MSPTEADDAAPGDDELQLPVLGLYADLELGRGSVLLPDELLQCSGLSQLRIIDQWQRALAQYRCNALRQLQAELRARNPELDPVDQLAWLRATCEKAGIAMAPGADLGSASP